MRRVTAVMVALLGIALAVPAAQGADAPETFYLVKAERPLRAALVTGAATLKGEGFEAAVAEVVVVGPAVHGLQKGSSVEKLVKDSIKAGVKVVACEQAMKHEKVSAASLIDGVDRVPNGFFEVFRLQQKGYLFIMM